MKALGRGRFRAAAAIALLLAGCSPSDGGSGKGFILRAPPKAEDRAQGQAWAPPPAGQAAGSISDQACHHASLGEAARTNAVHYRNLAWSPFGREERGWGTYYRLVSREIGSACPPDSPGFAAALARWQANNGLPQTGVLDEAAFVRMKTEWQLKRPVVRSMREAGCPAPPSPGQLAAARPEESYGGKTIELRRGALAAYRRMVQAARAEEPRIAEDARNLTIFSGYRSPEYDDARCERDGNCNGVVRARCSPHRTGLAMDLYVGQAPGYGPDSSADPNRLYMTRTATYAWLTANAHRFGFVNYPFEPWHWEWTGEAP
ncbi:MAG: M15 family metallopeptidase [Phenylobacterium sp.]|jgi:LAS superfamily LD-carboxypeptidase LdcB|uniref:M15 family metallopeptidase n=1 Tax=Phenylobacterium sp. TaxID=1871053 RepID=UPI002A35AF42|nr:M15 family metallopeptidase [Phenylobacterium sp.]MDX9997479.1 M15 family metallopeptidase [Phenylobacterium sp.]